MKRIKQAFIILFAVILTIMAPVSSYETAAAQKAPSLNARVTAKNIQTLLKKYDPDGAYIMQKQIAKGDDICVWFSGQDRIIDNIDTAIHEETHRYSHFYAKGYDKTAYFVGNRKTIYVTHTKVYRSKIMAGSIPKKMRTFRYNTYIAKPIANLSSNVEGAYGLLNEFMAYQRGMNTVILLFPYLKKQDADWNAWHSYISDCENGRLAYAEFKYYILHYLYYAKKHYPDVYKGIVNNRQFCRAYRTLEKNFRKCIKQYENDLKKLNQIVGAHPGYWLEITDEHIMLHNDYGGIGMGRFTEDYRKLCKETAKKKYQSIHKALVKKGA